MTPMKYVLVAIGWGEQVAKPAYGSVLFLAELTQTGGGCKTNTLSRNSENITPKRVNGTEKMSLS